MILGASKQALWAIGGRANSHFSRLPRYFPQQSFAYIHQALHLQRTHRDSSTDTASHETEKENKRFSRETRSMKMKSQKKLHNRIFSEEERAEDSELRQIMKASRSESDAFGTLLSSDRTKVDYLKNPQILNSEHASQLFETYQQSAAPAGASVKKKNSKHTTDGMNEGGVRKITGENIHSRLVSDTDNWGDVFGTLQGDELEDRIQESLSTAVGSHEERFLDDEDESESGRIHLSKYNRRHIPEWYGRKILKLGRHGQVRDAIEVFEDWMLKQDRVMPNSYVFTCLITVLGRAGYTKKAFSLFNRMKKMGITPKPATYTALFNACSNSPWKEDGRTRADNLYRLMKEKEVAPTFITGKAMIKAFAICGDLRKAFSLMDELSQVYRPDQESFSFLLMACVSDREEGLRHAIQVWRLMREMGVMPDLPLYNLLLRCIRDCGVRDTPSLHTLLTGNKAPDDHLLENPVDSDKKDSFSKHSSTSSDMLTLQTLEVASGEKSDSVSSNTCSVSDSTAETPRYSSQGDTLSERLHSTQVEEAKSYHLNRSHVQSSSLIAQKPSAAKIPDVLSPASQQTHSSQVVSLGDLSTKENRLELFGGMKGILARMTRDKVKPNVITFTQLIAVTAPTEEAENKLLAAMKKMRVKPDIDLVNTLIHKRCMRKDLSAAKAAKELIVDNSLTANQMTYGVLAMTCRTQADAEQLLDDIEQAQLAPNMEIMGALMYAANTNFHYRVWVLKQVQQLDLVPNKQFLKNIEQAIFSARQKTVAAENKKDYGNFFLSKIFQDCFRRFVEYYDAWLKDKQVMAARHPWDSFRTTKKETASVK